MRTYFAVLAVACFVTALVLLVRRLSVVVKGVTSTGRVVAFETREDDGSRYYLPVVVFTDREGRSHQFTSVAGGSNPTPAIGSELSVRYLPDHPRTVFVESFLHMWAAPLGLAALGAGAVLAYIGW